RKSLAASARRPAPRSSPSSDPSFQPPKSKAGISSQPSCKTHKSCFQPSGPHSSTWAVTPPEFRQPMGELYHAGRSSTELSQDFGPNAQSIRNWVAWAKRDADQSGQEGGENLSRSEREELDRLRRENRQLRREREILSKATAWFARE